MWSKLGSNRCTRCFSGPLRHLGEIIPTHWLPKQQHGTGQLSPLGNRGLRGDALSFIPSEGITHLTAAAKLFQCFTGWWCKTEDMLAETKISLYHHHSTAEAPSGRVACGGQRMCLTVTYVVLRENCDMVVIHEINALISFARFVLDGWEKVHSYMLNFYSVVLHVQTLKLFNAGT